VTVGYNAWLERPLSLSPSGVLFFQLLRSAIAPNTNPASTVTNQEMYVNPRMSDEAVVMIVKGFCMTTPVMDPKNIPASTVTRQETYVKP